jgi:3'(2'), 5'-bisphosphate nucleotidase
MNPKTLLDPLIDISRTAGDEILKIYNAGFEIYEKEDLSPLTDADLASNRCIVAALEKLTPGWHLLSLTAPRNLSSVMASSPSISP